MNKDKFLIEMNKFMNAKYQNFRSPINAMSLDLGVSRQYIGQVLNGRKPPSETILKWIGYKKTSNVTVTYTKEVK